MSDLWARWRELQMKVENVLHPCKTGESPTQPLRVLAERTGCPRERKLREGCQVEMTIQIPEEPEPSKASPSQRGAEHCPDQWPFPGTGPSTSCSTVACCILHVGCRSERMLPHSELQVCGSFPERMLGFPPSQARPAKKNRKPLHWLTHPRPQEELLPSLPSL